MINAIRNRIRNNPWTCEQCGRKETIGKTYEEDNVFLKYEIKGKTMILCDDCFMTMIDGEHDWRDTLE